MTLAACGVGGAPADEAAEWTPIRFSGLPGWADDRHDEAAEALRRSCGVLARQPGSRSLGGGGLAGTVADWRPICEALEEAGAAGGAEASRAFFEEWFVPHGTDADGLFTGYYEPTLAASRTRSDVYSAPLYARPDDLVSVGLADFREALDGEEIVGQVVDGRLRPYEASLHTPPDNLVSVRLADFREVLDEEEIFGRVVDGRLRPYDARREIAAGSLDGRGLEIAWADPVDVFFLQTQGSGSLALDDGSVLRLGYHANNGRSSTLIGKVLIQEGALEREAVSMQSIRAWLAANPGEAERVMNVNERYIFFRRLSTDGPVGAQGAVVTPRRSLAVDRRFVPLSVPVWVDVPVPAADGGGGMTPFRRLTIAQDTGGAVRGPVRGDVFWGAGEEAAEVAGRMKSRGRYWLLLPRSVVPPG